MRSLRMSLVVVVLLLGAIAGSANAAPVREAPFDVASCGVDEFTGTALDTARWKTIVRPNPAGYAVSGGQLKLKALTGDMYGDRATAQNLILQDVPSGAWTATTQLDSKAFTREGQQAGFIVYKDDSTFSKFTVINKGTDGRWFEHIFTADKVARLVIGTDTTPALGDSFPAKVLIRVISDGETIRGEYSGDGIVWAPIGRPAKIGPGVKLGLYAADNAQDGPEVAFDYVSLNAQSDEFSGTELEKCRWSHIEREQATGYRVANGALELDTGADEIDGAAPNLIGQPVPAGTWQAETKIDLTTALEGQQAGLLLYKDPANWIKVVLVDKGATSQIEFVRVKDGGYQLDDPFKVDVPATLTSFSLRLRSGGTTATAQYSTNGTTWVDVGKARDISDLGAGSLGPVALRGDAATPVTAKFDYVRVAPSPVVACTASGTPEAGYERLWNGLDMAGTTQAGPGGFDIVNDGTEGCRLVSRGGLGLLWFNTKTYDNFVLRAQFKTADDTDNSGIFVRFPNPGTDQQIPIDQGHEIQIREGVAGDGEDQKTGSIYNTKRETARAAKPAGQWNDYEIRYEKDVYTITLNGTVVNTYTNTTGTHARSAGYIGLQNHSVNDEVSFRNVRILPLATAPVTNVFTTVGITTNATRGNGQIYPPNNPYSLKAELMPPSGTVGVAPNDDADNVPLRMPDTTGTKPNFAAMRGQVFTLRDADQKAYTKLHFFGTTTDGGPAGGDFTLTYTDGTTATVNVQFPDWCGNGNASAHYAIGKLNGRYQANSTGDGAGCGIYHFPIDNPQPAKLLKSVTFPPATSGGGNTQAYVMAFTFEATGAIFTTPDLSGQIAFPDDKDAPITTLALDPGEPNGDGGWYAGPVRVTLTGKDEDGGSGVEQISYRVDGGAPQGYTGPFDYATDGEHTLEYRSIDGAGNAETYKPITLKVDAKAPTTSTLLTPGLPLGDAGWYDGAVTVRLSAADGAGSGVPTGGTEYRLDGATEWTTYEAPVTIETAGVHELEYRSSDVAGNREASQALSLKVDKTAPTTAIRLNGAAPVAEYTSAVRVVFTRDDGDGSGAVETEYRLDGGDWKSYSGEGAFDVKANSGHKVDYRSIDLAGNVENFKSLIFVIRPPATLPAPAVVIPQATPAPAPKPSASLENLSSKLSTVTALRRGKVVVAVSCQAVDRGTLSLTVTKAVAKKLGLKSTTLAGGALRCSGGRGTLTLKPSTKVKRALAKAKGSITATLTLRLTGTAGSARDTQTVTLEGKS